MLLVGVVTWVGAVGFCFSVSLVARGVSGGCAGAWSLNSFARARYSWEWPETSPYSSISIHGLILLLAFRPILNPRFHPSCLIFLISMSFRCAIIFFSSLLSAHAIIVWGFGLPLPSVSLLRFCHKNFHTSLCRAACAGWSSLPFAARPNRVNSCEFVSTLSPPASQILASLFHVCRSAGQHAQWVSSS